MTQQPPWGQQPPQQQPYQSHPHPQQQPYQPHPYPQQQPGPGWGVPPPQPPRKSSAGKIVGFSCLGIVGLFLVIGIVGAVLGGSTESSGDGKSDRTVADKPAPGEKPAEKPAEKEEPVEKKEPTQAEEFKRFVEENGTAAERKAVEHVTKVQGADEQNGVLDTAEVFTDFTGGLLGPHNGDGKLIASAFADWRQSENGLVTVYDVDGEMLANGNF